MVFEFVVSRVGEDCGLIILRNYERFLGGGFPVAPLGNFTGGDSTYLQLLMIYLHHVSLYGVNSNKKLVYLGLGFLSVFSVCLFPSLINSVLVLLSTHTFIIAADAL